MANAFELLVVILFIFVFALISFYSIYYRWKIQSQVFATNPAYGQLYFTIVYIIIPIITIIAIIYSAKNPPPRREHFCTEESCSL